MQKMTVSVEKEQAERIENRVDNGVAENRSEALRQELRNANRVTPVRNQIDRLGNVFAIAGLTLIGLTFFYPIEIRIFSLFPLLASIICYFFGQYAKSIQTVVYERVVA